MSADHNGAKSELRRSFSSRVLAAAVGMVATFLLTVIVVRFLNTRDAAAFFGVLAALPIGSIVGRVGLGNNVVRLIPSEPDPERKRIIAGTHLRATFLMTLPTAPIIALCATAGLIGHSNFVPALLLTSLMVLIESIRMMLSDIYSAVGRVFASVATTHYLRSIVVLPVVAVVAFSVAQPTLVEMLLAYTAVSAGQVLIALVAGRSDIALRHTPGLASLRRTIASGARLFTLELTAFLIVSGTIWLSNAALPPHDAKLYAVATTIAIQVTILESLAATAVLPPAARMWVADRKPEVLRMLSNLATVNTVITTTVVLMLVFFGGFFLELAYGPGLRDANILLVILAVGGIPQAALSVNTSLLIIAGHLDAVCRTSLIVLALVVPGTIAAALLGGALPLAIVAAAGLSALYIGQWFTARRIFGDTPKPRWHVATAARELVSERGEAAEPVTAPVV
ncbi:MAG: lipopolysaccharide biosynthesis protein [Mycolicibacterium cosmeticum]|nr:lipopolysaccharide biosynthesis protein [Mycolicibacterium cosmeticum]